MIPGQARAKRGQAGKDAADKKKAEHPFATEVTEGTEEKKKDKRFLPRRYTKTLRKNKKIGPRIARIKAIDTDYTDGWLLDIGY